MTENAEDCNCYYMRLTENQDCKRLQFVFGHTHTRRNIYSCNLVIKKSNVYSLFDSVILIRSSLFEHLNQPRFTRSFGEIIDLISLGKSYTISLKTHTLFLTYNSTLLNRL